MKALPSRKSHIDIVLGTFKYHEDCCRWIPISYMSSANADMQWTTMRGCETGKLMHYFAKECLVCYTCLSLCFPLAGSLLTGGYAKHIRLVSLCWHLSRGT